MYFSDAEIRSLRDSGHLGPQDVPYDLPTSAAAFRDLLNTMYKDDRTAILNGASYARMYYNNLVNGVEAPSKP
jgi:hypothetical protein